MRIQRPVARVGRGQALTARLWNSAADAINGGLSAPRDLDGGVESPPDAPLVADRSFRKISETTDLVRVEDPENPDVFVDVERVLSVRLRDTVTGEVWDLPVGP